MTEGFFDPLRLSFSYCFLASLEKVTVQFDILVPNIKFHYNELFDICQIGKLRLRKFYTLTKRNQHKKNTQTSDYIWVAL